MSMWYFSTVPVKVLFISYIVASASTYYMYVKIKTLIYREQQIKLNYVLEQEEVLKKLLKHLIMIN